MPDAVLDDFRLAAREIGANGENDTLPYDIDALFIKENADRLSDIAYNFYLRIESESGENAAAILNSISVPSERLLLPSGFSGFRISNRIHPFWNFYLNGLGACVARLNEPFRSGNVHSYRFFPQDESFFDKSKSWRQYKEATVNDPFLNSDGSIVIQTDVSSFYERVYHHRLENCLRDLCSSGSKIPVQVSKLLSQLASGRSFGLPIGGQCARILAEVIMCPIDQSLSDNELVWHRYVDDYTIICNTTDDAYRALAVLSHALADYGLSLNRSKTVFLSSNHYRDYVEVQLGAADDTSIALREIDLHFDPYSDSAIDDYHRLKQTVGELDIKILLDLETNKAQPDSFVVAQISRTLRFHDANTAAQLCATLLDPVNLNSFRASWSTIMRGIYSLRSNEEFNKIHDDIDDLLDQIPVFASHLIVPEANILHYLRSIRFKRTNARGRFVRRLFSDSSCEMVKRACIECWMHWRDRSSFNSLRNQWQSSAQDIQRMIWLASYHFGDEGRHTRRQTRHSLPGLWSLGIEEEGDSTFATLFRDWAENAI